MLIYILSDILVDIFSHRFDPPRYIAPGAHILEYLFQ